MFRINIDLQKIEGIKMIDKSVVNIDNLVSEMENYDFVIPKDVVKDHASIIVKLLKDEMLAEANDPLFNQGLDYAIHIVEDIFDI